MITYLLVGKIKTVLTAQERINSLPEVISLKLADSELESTKLEYEELLDEYENLVEKINKYKEENSMINYISIVYN